MTMESRSPPGKPAGTNGRAALILARPGALRNGLRAMLNVLTGIEVVEEADADDGALTLITQQCPALAVLDAGLSGDTVQFLQKAKQLCPRTCWIVLIDHPEQRSAALAAGATAVLLKGLAAERLFDTVECLLAG
jgi:DNA-binding NarL/FixJ family response regulator